MDDKTDMSTKGTNFIAIESFYRLSYARELCLKADDVFVVSITTQLLGILTNLIINEDYEELPALFTVFRKGEFFEVFVEQFNCNYKYASDEDVAKITEKLPEHQIEPKENYKSFEAQREMRVMAEIIQHRTLSLCNTCAPILVALSPHVGAIGRSLSNLCRDIFDSSYSFRINLFDDECLFP